MSGLVPGIHVLEAAKKKIADGRVKPAYDEFYSFSLAIATPSRAS